MDRKNFYNKVRRDFGKLTQEQVNGFEAILNEWDDSGYTDVRWLAYMLATAWHETGCRMVPCEEIGKGRGYRYGKKLKRSGVAYNSPNKIYYGRGHVQLTWYENYQLMGRLLGVDLLTHPEKALEMEISIRIMFEGMLRGASSFGDFTGRCLEMYFNDKANDPINARRIVNGLDKAELVASHYNKFLNALR